MRTLFGQARNGRLFLYCVFVLVPNYFITGLLLTLSPEIGKATGVQGAIKANIAIALYFGMSAVGDLMGAWLSERFKSRKLVAGLYVLGNAVLCFIYVQPHALSLNEFYTLCAIFGLFNLWAISGTIVVEQFPTNIRATASTASLNFSRACVILANLLFLALKPSLGLTQALLSIGIGIFALGLLAVIRLPESYGQSLRDAV